jgi:CheY-like chemotaxis protein
MTPLVLVVDNEVGLLGLFSRLVQGLGYQVLEADSGMAALEILEQQVPDLLILDLAMPEVSGFDVLRRVMVMPHLERMRVMVLTAIGPGPAPDDVRSRIDAWIAKPISPDAFNAAVRELTGAP